MPIRSLSSLSSSLAESLAWRRRTSHIELMSRQWALGQLIRVLGMIREKKDLNLGFNDDLSDVPMDELLRMAHATAIDETFKESA